ncbi:uncharacterized protein LOC134805345 [Cydia splendana]|uniref:uncharacterized protein LOC134805345 n=1 Tax=Cydia splendana TaxID=1100963 RepID=UPI0028F47E6F
MKAMFVVPLLLCAWAHAGSIHQKSEANRIGVNDLQVNMLARDNVFSKDDQLIATELDAMDTVARNAFENRIRILLESFRDVVINGNDNFPILDPLILGPLGPVAVDIAPGTRANFVIPYFHLDGLRWYVVDDVTFSPLRLTVGLHVTVPWLTFTGNYEAEARLGFLILHRAGGNYRVFINRLEVGVDLRLGTNLLGGHLLLRELNIKIDIQDVNIRIEGMLGSNVLNNLINHFVQSITRDVVQNEMQNLSKLLSEELFDVINEVLKDYTLADILD